MTNFKPLSVLSLITLVMVVTTTAPINTHTPIASRWNYNEHLFPIFRDNCGSCHKTDGIAPMSLVTYQEAYPWAQSIREEILGLRMPPGQAEDGFGTFTVNHALSAEEMDMILEWSSGGYPQGPRNLQPDTISNSNAWSLGTPALQYSIETPFAIDDGTNEIVRFFVIPAANNEAVNISAIDVIPDAGPVVRNVAVYLDSTGTASELDANLALLKANGSRKTNLLQFGPLRLSLHFNRAPPISCHRTLILSFESITRKPGLPKVSLLMTRRKSASICQRHLARQSNPLSSRHHL